MRRLSITILLLVVIAVPGPRATSAAQDGLSGSTVDCRLRRHGIVRMSIRSSA